MPNSDPRDGFFYPTLTIMIFSYNNDTLHYLLDNAFITFGSKLYRRIVGIPMGTYCAPLVVILMPLVADLFLFCYEISF